MSALASRRGCLRSAGVVALTLLVALALGVLFVPPVQTAARTVLLLPELIELPIRPLSAFTTKPDVESTTYGAPGDRIDVYTPAGASADRALPGVVLALGVHPQPIDHPDIVRIAEAISRLGVVVGVPDSTALRNTQVTPDEPAHLADAALLIADRPEVDPARVGIAGFSAGASIGVMSAADERIAGSLRWVSAFGAYADARLLLIDVATRTMDRDGTTLGWTPDPGIRRDVLNLFLGAIDRPSDAQRLRPLLEPVVAAEAPPTGADESIADGFEGDAQVAYRLFTAPDRQTAQAAIDAASAELKQQLAGISPVNFAAAVEAPVFVMHGETDRAIPISHAALLVESLGSSVARFTRFGRFEHGQPGAEGLDLEDAPDVWELLLYLHAIVAAATE